MTLYCPRGVSDFLPTAVIVPLMPLPFVPPSEDVVQKILVRSRHPSLPSLQAPLGQRSCPGRSSPALSVGVATAPAQCLELGSSQEHIC